MSRRENVLLGEIMAPRLGTVDPSNFSDEEFDYYSIPAYDTGAPFLTYGREIGSAKQTLQPDDVVLSRIVPHIRRAWVVGQNSGRRIIGSGEWIVFRSHRFDPAYLRHLLVSDSFHPELMRTVSGVGGSLLRARPTNVARIEIPLPPIEEQRRIAAILDQAESLRAKRRQALAKLDTLTQSLFLEMFGDPFAVSRAWRTASLSTVASVINDCPHSTPMWTNSGKRCLRTTNLLRGAWFWSDERFVSESTYHARSSRGYLIAGDIVLSREGTVGIAAIVPSGMEACMGQRLVQVRPNPDKATSEYLLEFLLQILAPDRISKVMVGSTAQHLNVRELKAISVPLPPLSLQMQFSAAVGQLTKLRSTCARSSSRSASLFQSLQHRAFR